MMAYRPEWWPNCAGVLDLCQRLHEHTCGSSDPMSDDDLAATVRCLEWVRDNWKQPSSMYDRAVNTLVVRALNERNPQTSGPPDCIRVVCHPQERSQEKSKAD